MRVSLPYSLLVAENSRLSLYLVKSHPAQYGAVWTRSVTFGLHLPPAQLGINTATSNRWSVLHGMSALWALSGS
jgi:hypothetical protein